MQRWGLLGGLLWGVLVAKAAAVGMRWGLDGLEALGRAGSALCPCTSALATCASLWWGVLGEDSGTRGSRAGNSSAPARGCSALREAALWELGRQKGWVLTLPMEAMGIAVFDPVQLLVIPIC